MSSLKVSISKLSSGSGLRRHMRKAKWSHITDATSPSVTVTQNVSHRLLWCLGITDSDLFQASALHSGGVLQVRESVCGVQPWGLHTAVRSWWSHEVLVESWSLGLALRSWHSRETLAQPWSLGAAMRSIQGLEVHSHPAVSCSFCSTTRFAHLRLPFGPIQRILWRTDMHTLRLVYHIYRCGFKPIKQSHITKIWRLCFNVFIIFCHHILSYFKLIKWPK